MVDMATAMDTRSPMLPSRTITSQRITDMRSPRMDMIRTSHRTLHTLLLPMESLMTTRTRLPRMSTKHPRTNTKHLLMSPRHLRMVMRNPLTIRTRHQATDMRSLRTKLPATDTRNHLTVTKSLMLLHMANHTTRTPTRPHPTIISHRTITSPAMTPTPSLAMDTKSPTRSLHTLLRTIPTRSPAMIPTQSPAMDMRSPTRSRRMLHRTTATPSPATIPTPSPATIPTPSPRTTATTMDTRLHRTDTKPPAMDTPSHPATSLMARTK
ncbi:hypothetical protein RvY_14889-2 [Ramazzottius varieornatus]|uniref:Uncharacterized protein n=1 Tax=Ramazzottius varieornatus TaxID=947166 RepID=A0A1D1VXT4_RAMVA|nr:hypothetical protein RvY_14889-2 [Ramazzottius varieornatus]